MVMRKTLQYKTKVRSKMDKSIKCQSRYNLQLLALLSFYFQLRNKKCCCCCSTVYFLLFVRHIRKIQLRPVICDFGDWGAFFLGKSALAGSQEIHFPEGDHIMCAVHRKHSSCCWLIINKLQYNFMHNCRWQICFFDNWHLISTIYSWCLRGPR